MVTEANLYIGRTVIVYSFNMDIYNKSLIRIYYSQFLVIDNVDLPPSRQQYGISVILYLVRETAHYINQSEPKEY